MYVQTAENIFYDSKTWEEKKDILYTKSQNTS